MTLTVRILSDSHLNRLEEKLQELLMKIPTANFRDIKYCMIQETPERYVEYSAMVIFEI